MKLTAPALVLVSFGSIAVAGDAPIVAGGWQVRSLIAGNDSTVKCAFAQRDAELSGTCDTVEGGKVDLAGKVEGAKVTWSFKSQYNGSPLTANFEGTLEEGKIRGVVRVPEFSVEGEFTATREP